MRFALALLLTLFTGCATNPAAPSTPTAPQSVDLTLSKALLDAQTAIEAAKGLVMTYPGMKDPLNRIIASYNTIEAAYIVYHNAVARGANPDPAMLQAQINQLVTSATGLVALYKGTP